MYPLRWLNRIDHDGKVVVQIHGKITAQFGSHNRLRILVVAVDSEVNMVGVVQDAHFGFLCGRAGFEWFSLAEIRDG